MKVRTLHIAPLYCVFQSEVYVILALIFLTEYVKALLCALLNIVSHYLQIVMSI